jgi:hypothetical protein
MQSIPISQLVGEGLSQGTFPTIKYYNLPIKLYIVKPSEFSTTLLYDPNKPATRLLGGEQLAINSSFVIECVLNQTRTNLINIIAFTHLTSSYIKTK